MLTSPVIRTTLAGVLSLAVLSGMLVLHAWPLWTGETIYLRVRPVDPRDLFRGDYVTLSYDLSTVRLQVPAELRRDTTVPPQPGVTVPPPPPEVAPVGDWWRRFDDHGRYSGRTLYLQLEPQPSSVPGVPRHYVPVSISDTPVDGVINLAGQVTFFSYDYTVRLNFGIDALFVEEGAGRPIERAIRDDAPVFADVAVTRRGTARVRALVIEGQVVR